MAPKSNPFDDIERMFGRLSDQFAGIDPVELGGSLGGIAVDVRDEGDEIVVLADLPGYHTDEIEVTLTDERTLHLYAERERETEETDEAEDGVYVRRERTHESTERSVSLPDPVEEDGTTAAYDNGVLTVTLAKQSADDEGQSIPVE
jgi:HSP20 family protein